MIAGRKLMTQMINEATLQIATYMRVFLLFDAVRDIID